MCYWDLVHVVIVGGGEGGMSSLVGGMMAVASRSGIGFYSVVFIFHEDVGGS